MNTISLGGVALNGEMLIRGRDSSHAVEQSTKRTLGGSLVVFYSTLKLGQDLDLVASDSQGWITKAMVDSLLEMSNTPGGVYQLTVNGESRSVMFRNHEQPSFEAQPLVYRNNQEVGDYYVCVAKLMTV